MSSLFKTHKLHLAIEGIDGTGKSTALDATQLLLEQRGLSVSTVHYTHKSGLIGKTIGAIYNPAAQGRIIKRVQNYRPLQAALYATNGRINLLKTPRVTDVLLADRSILSGYASHVDRVPSWLISVVESTQAPDVIAYLELPISEASKRISAREAGDTGYEEDYESLQMFSDDYEKVFNNLPKRLGATVIERLDALKDPIDVARSIAQIAFKYL